MVTLDHDFNAFAVEGLDLVVLNADGQAFQ
jgi:hypothetical protein